MDAVPKSLGWHRVKICFLPSLKVSERVPCVPCSLCYNSLTTSKPLGECWRSQNTQGWITRASEIAARSKGKKDVSKAKVLMIQQTVTAVRLKQSWRCPEPCVSPPASLTQREELPITAIVYLLMAYRLNKQREIHLLYPKAYRAQGCSMKYHATNLS